MQINLLGASLLPWYSIFTFIFSFPSIFSIILLCGLSYGCYAYYGSPQNTVSVKNFYIKLLAAAVVTIVLVNILQVLSYIVFAVLRETDFSQFQSRNLRFFRHPEVIVLLLVAVIGGGYALVKFKLPLFFHMIAFTISVGLVEELSKLLSAYYIYVKLTEKEGIKKSPQLLFTCFIISGFGFGFGEALLYMGYYNSIDAPFMIYLIRVLIIVPLQMSWAILTFYLVRDWLSESTHYSFWDFKRFVLPCVLAALPAACAHGIYNGLAVHKSVWALIFGVVCIVLAVMLPRKEYRLGHISTNLKGYVSNQNLAKVAESADRKLRKISEKATKIYEEKAPKLKEASKAFVDSLNKPDPKIIPPAASTDTEKDGSIEQDNPISNPDSDPKM